MPRWASRITLEILKMRVENLQEITCGGYFVRSDIVKEGCPRENIFENDITKEMDWFIKLWNSIYKSPYGWEDNPLIRVIEFKMVES